MMDRRAHGAGGRACALLAAAALCSVRIQPAHSAPDAGSLEGMPPVPRCDWAADRPCADKHLRSKAPVVLTGTGFADHLTSTRPEPFNFTPMGVNPISSGSPRVRPMGRTCG